MLINTPGLTVRTRPIDNASADYDLELNHSRHTRTPATAITLAGESSATHPATSTEMTRAIVPHYGKPPCIPFYRDNHAPSLAMSGTPRCNTLRGPPGSSRKPRGAQRAASKQRDVDRKIPPACGRHVNARLRRRLTRKQTEKNRRKKGLGAQTPNLYPQS